MDGRHVSCKMMGIMSGCLATCFSRLDDVVYRLCDAQNPLPPPLAKSGFGSTILAENGIVKMLGSADCDELRPRTTVAGATGATFYE